MGRFPFPRPIPVPSDSYAKIYAVVRRIPPGRVATYGQVAALAGLPSHARLVGYALHAVAEGSSIPWHRVLNAQGRISIRGSASATVTQRVRLEQEGVRFAAGRVKLDEFGWKPRKAIGR
jgi:methylated-DNA-protein-cysteine methyltransferase-like protein